MAKILQRQAINPILNSNFDFWQRGTSGSVGSNSGSNGISYLADRFQWVAIPNGGTTATFTQSRQAMPAGGDPAFKIQPNFFWRLNNTTQGTSLGVSSEHYLNQSIESVNKIKPGKNTISFMARSTIVGKQINVGALQSFGSGGGASAGVLIAGQSVTLTSSWRRYSVEINVPSIAGKVIGTDNNDCFRIFFFLQQGSSSASSFGLSGITFGGTGDTDFSQIQINEGGLLDYVPANQVIAQEFIACQRYFELIGGANSVTTQFGAGLSVNTTIASGTVMFKTTKRAAPAVSFSSQTGFRFNNASNNFASSAMSVSITTPFSLGFNLTTTGIAGGNIPGNMDSASTASIFVDAEF
jgi:hypothetical protein